MPHYDPSTLAFLIGLQLSRFPGSCDYWTIADPRWPNQVGIQIGQLGPRYIPVDGQKFLSWLSSTPNLTWADVITMLSRKQKQLHHKTKKHD